MWLCSCGVSSASFMDSGRVPLERERFTILVILGNSSLMNVLKRGGRTRGKVA